MPGVTFPKLKLLAESVTGVPPPVPDKLTTCGLFGPLSVKVSAPLKDPTALGENVTPTVHFAPAGTLVPHVLLATLKLPLVTMLEKLTATLV